jgi:hypothetical protein
LGDISDNLEDLEDFVILDGVRFDDSSNNLEDLGDFVILDETFGGNEEWKPLVPYTPESSITLVKSDISNRKDENNASSVTTTGGTPPAATSTPAHPSTIVTIDGVVVGDFSGNLENTGDFVTLNETFGESENTKHNSTESRISLDDISNEGGDENNVHEDKTGIRDTYTTKAVHDISEEDGGENDVYQVETNIKEDKIAVNNRFSDTIELNKPEDENNNVMDNVHNELDDNVKNKPKNGLEISSSRDESPTISEPNIYDEHSLSPTTLCALSPTSLSVLEAETIGSPPILSLESLIRIVNEDDNVNLQTSKGSENKDQFLVQGISRLQTCTESDTTGSDGSNKSNVIESGAHGANMNMDEMAVMLYVNDKHEQTTSMANDNKHHMECKVESCVKLKNDLMGRILGVELSRDRFKKARIFLKQQLKMKLTVIDDQNNKLRELSDESDQTINMISEYETKIEDLVNEARENKDLESRYKILSSRLSVEN